MGSLTPQRDRDGSYHLSAMARGGIPRALAARADERERISAMELKPMWWRWHENAKIGGLLDVVACKLKVVPRAQGQARIHGTGTGQTPYATGS